MLDGFVELQNVLLVLLYDYRCTHRSVVQVVGFCAEIAPWGIEWGGSERSRFLKNLLLKPQPNGRGRCISFSSPKLLQLGLELDTQVARWRDRRRRAARRLRLPSLWAGFQKSVAAGMTPQGPEHGAEKIKASEVAAKQKEWAAAKQRFASGQSETAVR